MPNVMTLSKEQALALLSNMGDEERAVENTTRTTCNVFETAGELQAHLAILAKYERGDLVKNLDGQQGIFMEFNGTFLDVLVATELPEVQGLSPMFVVEEERWPMACIDTGWGRLEKDGEVEAHLKRLHKVRKAAAADALVSEGVN